MEKNVYLLAMSTLRIKGEDKIISRSRYQYSEMQKGEAPIEGYSQLEPISKMLIRRKIYPDKIIVLCTDATKEKVEFYLQETPNELHIESPYEFYKKRILEYLPPKYRRDDLFCPVMIDPQNINNGIKDAVNHIRQEAEGCDWEQFQLWIDTQGGFRDISLVMNAITSLLQDIKVKGHYSIPYNPAEKEKIHMIEKQTQNYKVFDFVSGMKEFISYGRAEWLSEYYKDKKSVGEIIRTMKGLADAIQLCNPDEFESYLGELTRHMEEYRSTEMEHDELFSIFIDEVVHDYGVLLKEDCRQLDVVAWCIRKKFYQQALTFVESKIAKELFLLNVLKYEIKSGDEKELANVKDAAGRNWEQSENYVLFQYVNDAMKNHTTSRKVNICSTFSRGSIEIKWEKLKAIITKKKEKTGVPKLNKGQQYELKINENNEKKKKKATCVLSITTHCKDAVKLQGFLYLFKMLKNERNEVNHFSSKKRAGIEEIKSALDLFVELGEELYEQAR